MKKLSFDFDGFSSGLFAGFVMFMLLAVAFSIISIGQIIILLAPESVKTGFLPPMLLVVLLASLFFGVVSGFDGSGKKLPLDTRRNFVRMYTIDGACGVLNVRNVNSVSRLHNGQALPYGMYSVEINGAGGAMVFAKCRSSKNPWLKELIDAAGMKEWD